jgi:chromosome segregation ATPase
VLERLDRQDRILEEQRDKEKLERMIAPIKDQFEMLTKTLTTKSDADPVLKQQMDTIKDSLSKMETDKRHSEDIHELTKSLNKSEDPLKYMRELEEMRSKYSNESRELELRIQQARDENLRISLDRAFDGLQRKIEDLEKKSKGEGLSINDVSKLGDTVKKLKDINREIGGGDEKTTLADRVIENAAKELPQTLQELAKAYSQSKKNQPTQSQEYPDQVVLTPDEYENIIRSRSKTKPTPFRFQDERDRPQPANPVVEKPEGNTSVDYKVNPSENIWDIESKKPEEPAKDITPVEPQNPVEDFKPEAPITTQDIPPETEPKKRSKKVNI